MDLESICLKWLKQNFRLDASIIGTRILGQKDLDRKLNLLLVRIDFVDDKGNQGDTVASIDMNSIRREDAGICTPKNFYKLAVFP